METQGVRCFLKIVILLCLWCNGCCAHNTSVADNVKYENHLTNGSELLNLMTNANRNQMQDIVGRNSTDDEIVIITEKIQHLEEESSEESRSDSGEDEYDVNVKMFPFVVSIQHEGNHYCGGVLLKKNWILTAARCFPFSLRFYTVLAGTNDALEFRGHKEGQRLDAKHVYRHEDYKFNQHPNDIALLEVYKEFKLGDTIKLISIAPAEQNQNTDITDINDKCIIIGYEYPDRHKKRIKREERYQPISSATISLMPLKECTGKVSGYKVTPNQFCSQNPRIKNTCYYTGGPAVWKDSDNDYVLQGIILHSDECGAKGGPLVYTRIDAYSNWIHAKLAHFSVRRILKPHRSSALAKERAALLLVLISLLAHVHISDF